jgi:hypothetical protein
MASLAVVNSPILGVAACGITTSLPVAVVGSLGLAIFGNGGNDAPLHAPTRRKRPSNGRLSSSSSTTTTSLSEAEADDNRLIQLYKTFLQLPQVFRFFVAGNLGNIGFFYLEKIISKLLSYFILTADVLSSFFLDNIEKYQDGMSFFSAYLIQIVVGHLLYAVLVYGMDTIDTYEKYSKTLWGQFKVYGVGLFGATFFNSYLIGAGFPKTYAFWITTAFFAVFNYFLVSYVVQQAMEESSSKASSVDAADLEPHTRQPTTRSWRR